MFVFGSHLSVCVDSWAVVSIAIIMVTATQYLSHCTQSHHRYQRAVSHLGLLAVSPPYVDGLGTGSVITLSQAILPARYIHIVSNVLFIV